MINKISFKNYKSFKENQELNLKPITILIGKNSSGKSAISKLLTLISGSLSGKFDPALKWDNKGIKLGLSNRDLVYNKNVTTSILEFGIGSGTNKLQITIGIDRKDKPNILGWSYNNNQLDVSKNTFKGFVPSGTSLGELKLNFEYIGPFRELPKSSYTNSFDSYNSIGINGANTYPILIQDAGNSGELIKEVSNWYENNFEGWKIEVIEIAAPEPTFQIVLSNKSITHINIVNVGQGMNQALPLIVRSYMVDEEDVRIIIEEPETHLHPSSHGNLAQRFVDSYISNNKKKYLIETHSQNFVLRIRRMIAEKKINIDDLGIYYVDFDEKTNESYLKEIIVNIEGGVDWWPEGVFTETLNETRAIRDAQLKDVEDVD